jgi:hypothetical protein
MRDEAERRAVLTKTGIMTSEEPGCDEPIEEHPVSGANFSA